MPLTHPLTKTRLARRKPPPQLLFVCRANQCRSVVCEAIANHYFGSQCTQSAGLLVTSNCPASVACEDFLNFKSIPIPTGGAKAVCRELMTWADTIVTMNAWQFQELSAVFHQHKEKIYCMSKWNQNKGILDPVNLNISPADSLRRLQVLESAIYQMFMDLN